MTALMIIFTLMRIAAAAMLLIALARNPPYYYILLRYLVCATSLLGAGLSYRKWFMPWFILFAVAAFLFNPMVPLYSVRTVWTLIDLAVAGVMLASIAWVKRAAVSKGQSAQGKKPQERKWISPEPGRPGREIEFWMKPLSLEELTKVQRIITEGLSGLEATDWSTLTLNAICSKSPALEKLYQGGRVDIAAMAQSERRGIEHSLKAVLAVGLVDGVCLRDYFHNLFEAVYRGTWYEPADRFYYFGRDRVIRLLRSFRASSYRFEPGQTHLGIRDAQGGLLVYDATITNETVEKIQKALALFEVETARHAMLDDIKERYRFKIETDSPYLEFDLDAIAKAKTYAHQGALVNCLYLELGRLLYVNTDNCYPQYHLATHALYDAEMAVYVYGDGVITLLRYKGTVEYFPDRLYVILEDIGMDTPLVRWLKSYKLHLEGND